MHNNSDFDINEQKKTWLIELKGVWFQMLYGDSEKQIGLAVS